MRRADACGLAAHNVVEVIDIGLGVAKAHAVSSQEEVAENLAGERASRDEDHRHDGAGIVNIATFGGNWIRWLLVTMMGVLFCTVSA